MSRPAPQETSAVTISDPKKMTAKASRRAIASDFKVPENHDGPRSASLRAKARPIPKPAMPSAMCTKPLNNPYSAHAATTTIRNRSSAFMAPRE